MTRQKLAYSAISNGGLMVQRLACESERSKYTYGVVAATLSVELKKTCIKTKNAQQMIYFFGDQDSAFLKNGLLVNPVKPKQIRGRHIGINESINFWHERNQCSKQSAVRMLDDKYYKKWGKWKDDHTRVQITMWDTCQAPLIWYKIMGGGHRWADPGTKNGVFSRKILNLGWASHEFSTADVFWDYILMNQGDKK